MPSESQWNMVHFGYVCVEHVDFMLFVTSSPALVPNANAVSGGIWASAYLRIVK